MIRTKVVTMPVRLTKTTRFTHDPQRSCRGEVIWWRQLVEQTRDGIVVVDKRGKVFWVNEPFAAMLGYTRDEAFDLAVWDWEANFPAEKVEEMLASVDETGAHFETTHRRKDGSHYDVEICTNAVMFDDEKFVLCVCRDITQRKQAEQELQTMLAATRALAEQLEHQQTMLVQSEKLASVGQLAAGVAHEINNPLSYILGNFATLGEYIDDLVAAATGARAIIELSGGAADAIDAATAELRELFAERDVEFAAQDARQLVAESTDGAERIRTIVNSLKGFVRRDDAQPSEAVVADMVESALVVTHNELKYRCETTCDVPADLPQIKCFPRQIEQVLMNLLVNASHAIEEKGTIAISARSLDGDHIEIRIRDDGKGISPENHKRIFDPFFTTKEVGKGTGLGLHIVHTIVERHGGKVTVESNVGTGTTFTIVLPTAGPPAES